MLYLQKLLGNYGTHEITAVITLYYSDMFLQ